MSDVDVEYAILNKGIKQLLGKEDYPPGDRYNGPCKHISDGFVYNKDAPNAHIIAIYQCAKCSVQYEVLVATGEEIK